MNQFRNTRESGQLKVISFNNISFSIYIDMQHIPFLSDSYLGTFFLDYIFSFAWLDVGRRSNFIIKYIFN